MNLGFYDLLLVVIVSIQATILAYLHQPRWKALVLTLPIPFTLACLALNRPIDATNVVGLILLLLFTHGVRVLYLLARLPIIAAIAVSTLGYCVAGWLLAERLPTGDAAFWLACALTLALAVLVLRLSPPREEPGYRSPLPVWIKLPIIVAVTFSLVLLKSQLRGFVTVFPMVGVIAAYEMRFSLWTTCRQIPVLMIALVLMQIVLRLSQAQLRLEYALLLGWVVFLIALVPLMRGHHKTDALLAAK